MVYKLLVKLAQPFIDLEFITGKQAESALQSIMQLNFWPSNYFNKTEIPTSSNGKIKHTLAEHLSNIDQLRSMLNKFEQAPNIVENHINNILSHFMPSNDAIQCWDKKSQYARLLELSQYAYYIKTDQNARNKIFNVTSKYGDLTISINLAKPEKTQAQIIAEKNAPIINQNEPRCGICIENLNFHGSLIKPSRENLRVIYESMNDESWFFQYSPYAYLNGHFVINDISHSPMQITDNSITKIFSFVDKHSEFMLGSNADLPIVGGSLLGHNHFQGALDRLPIVKAESFSSCHTHNCLLELLNWPMNVIRVTSNALNDCIHMVNHIINFWRSYRAKDLVNENNNTVTLIAEKKANNYICYVILRNNSTSESHPNGNYHFHADKFHIKQENIGLMEAAGLAILPGRLITEFKEIIDHFNKHNKSDFIETINVDAQLKKHSKWIIGLLTKHGTLNLDILLSSAADVFISGLEDCQIFKPNAFIAWFKKFLVSHPVVIDNGCGLKMELLNIGNIVKQIYVNEQPLLLEYKDVYQYLNNDILLNAFVGPACGRIEQGKIVGNQTNIQLPTDSKNNYIHGMNHKWSDLIYDIIVTEHKTDYHVSLTTQQTNPDLQTKYHIKNDITISKLNASLSFNYNVKCDHESLCNPSHHFYWTLNGENLLNSILDFSPASIWKLNQSNNPVEQKTIANNDNNLTITKWMDVLNKLTQQNQELIDHPFVLKNNKIVFSNQQIEMSMMPSLNELVIYTHFSKQPDLFKYQHNGICFESQYVPTSLANMNSKQILTKNYNSTVDYFFYVKR